MKQDENDQNHKKESTPVVDNKPNGKSQLECFAVDLKFALYVFTNATHSFATSLVAGFVTTAAWSLGQL